MRPPPCAPPILDIAGHAPIEHRRLQCTLRETRCWRGLFLNPRHHSVDTKADAHRTGFAQVSLLKLEHGILKCGREDSERRFAAGFAKFPVPPKMLNCPTAPTSGN